MHLNTQQHILIWGDGVIPNWLQENISDHQERILTLFSLKKQN